MDANVRFALVGPGRAGTAISEALVRAGWQVTAVAGRVPDASAARRFADRFSVEALPVESVARDAEVVIIATPDAAVEPVASVLAPTLRPGTLVVHLAGSFGATVFAGLRAARPDVRTAALHPLQTLTGDPADADHLVGAWFALDGDEAAIDLAEAVGGRVCAVGDRATYHAAAVVAANHLVALVGQVERLAERAGVPVEAFRPLMEAALDNALSGGAATALTGPVVRGDLATVAAHLDALPEGERPAYRALALEALRLSGRDDDELHSLLAAPAAVGGAS